MSEKPEPHILTGEGRLALHLSHWRGTSARAVLLIAPGLGDHCGRYGHFAQRLATIPGLVDVVGFDYRGHGRSDGRRGVVGHYNELVDDLIRAIDWLRERMPARPLYLLGHSNGGLVALVGLTEGRVAVDGLILSSPALRLVVQAPWWKLALGRLLNRVAPWVTLSGSLPPEDLSRDPEMIMRRQADPLVHSRISPPLFFGMLDAAERIRGMPERVRVPCLGLIGTADPVIDPEATIGFFDRLGSADRELLRIDGGVHEPLHDLGWERAVGRIGGWIEAHLAQEWRRMPASPNGDICGIAT